MWRQNHRPSSKRWTGVDLNRNYETENGGPSDIYPAEAVFTEPETQNIRDLFRRMKPRIVSFLSVHSVGKKVSCPWGYIDSENATYVLANVKELIRVGKLLVEALPHYGLGTAHELPAYGALGAAEDWALQEKPGIYAYCFELKPKNWEDDNFKLPPDQIRSTGQEFLRRILVLAQNMRPID